MNTSIPQAHTVIPQAHSVVPPRSVPGRPARRPEHLDLAAMRSRHGRVLGTLAVWRSRARARHELRGLALRGAEGVLEDVGLGRRTVDREAGRWFWQEFLD